MGWLTVEWRVFSVTNPCQPYVTSTLLIHYPQQIVPIDGTQTNRKDSSYLPDRAS
jgi:hypothetical protein